MNEASFIKSSVNEAIVLVSLSCTYIVSGNSSSGSRDDYQIVKHCNTLSSWKITLLLPGWGYLALTIKFDQD
jgi:hypothetical protein